MKNAFNLNGNIFDADEISSVYITALERTDSNYNTIYAVRIIIDGENVVIYEGIGIDARSIRDKIANVITMNAGIIKI